MRQEAHAGISGDGICRTTYSWRKKTSTMYVQQTSDFQNIGGSRFHTIALESPLSRAQELTDKFYAAPGLLNTLAESQSVYCHMCRFTPENKFAAMLKYNTTSKEALQVLKRFLRFCTKNRMTLWIFTDSKDFFDAEVYALVGKIATPGQIPTAGTTGQIPTPAASGRTGGGVGAATWVISTIILLVAVWWRPFGHLGFGWKLLLSVATFIVAVVIGMVMESLVKRND